jgi:hypothetical protein
LKNHGVYSAAAAAFITLAASGGEARENIAITDYTGRGFAPDVVSYTIAVKPGEAGELRLFGPDDKPVAFQVNDPSSISTGSALCLPPGPAQPLPRYEGKAMLSFVTGLPAGTSVVFTLSRDGQGAIGASALKTSVERDSLIMDNGLCAVKLPAPVEKKFDNPVAASTLPAPILAFRTGPKGAWLGSGKVRSERKVTAWRVKLAADGPVFAETIYELDYEGGGYYRAVVRLADQVPMARITEEYDLGRMVGEFTEILQINPAQEDWELNLTEGWKPDTYEKSKAWGNGGGGDTGVYEPLDQFKSAAIVNAGAYSGYHISGFGLFRAADTNAGPDFPGVGVTPLHNGFWRRAMDLHLVRPQPDQVTMLLPMTRTPPAWVETSPFCVPPNEPGKPYTYARRQWGLVLGPLPAVIPAKRGETNACRTYQARLTYGNIGLDRYKDFILEWPGAKKTDESAVSKADNDAAITASRRLGGLIQTAVGYAAQSHHAAADGYGIVTAAGNALKLPGVSYELRNLLRAQLALTSYLFVDADTNGQGSGSHTGNPNMSLARQGWISAGIAQLPDHPMHAAWRDYMAAWTEFKMADNMAPDGGWFEPGNYHEWGYWRLIHSMFGLEAMKAPGLKEITEYHSADSDFYMNLLTPVDPRYGSRLVPGFGNNANHHTDMYRDAAIALLKHKPKQAAELVWAWQANNPAPVKTPDILAPVKPVEPPLASRYYPGFGLVFRAHQGPEETYMLLRSGFLWSHWTVDQGNVALYSKGASLLPSQPYAYFTSELLDYSLENDIRFGHPSNEFRFGWPDSNVLDHRFGEKAQYAWASAGYPEWFINPGLSKGWKELSNGGYPFRSSDPYRLWLSPTIHRYGAGAVATACCMRR